MNVMKCLFERIDPSQRAIHTLIQLFHLHSDNDKQHTNEKLGSLSQNEIDYYQRIITL